MCTVHNAQCQSAHGGCTRCGVCVPPSLYLCSNPLVLFAAHCALCSTPLLHTTMCITHHMLWPSHDPLCTLSATPFAHCTADRARCASKICCQHLTPSLKSLFQHNRTESNVAVWPPIDFRAQRGTNLQNETGTLQHFDEQLKLRACDLCDCCVVCIGLCALQSEHCTVFILLEWVWTLYLATGQTCEVQR